MISIQLVMMTILVTIVVAEDRELGPVKDPTWLIKRFFRQNTLVTKDALCQVENIECDEPEIHFPKSLNYRLLPACGTISIVSAFVGKELFHVRIFTNRTKFSAIEGVLGPKRKNDPIEYFEANAMEEDNPPVTNINVKLEDVENTTPGMQAFFLKHKKYLIDALCDVTGYFCNEDRVIPRTYKIRQQMVCEFLTFSLVKVGDQFFHFRIYTDIYHHSRIDSVEQTPDPIPAQEFFDSNFRPDTELNFNEHHM